MEKGNRNDVIAQRQEKKQAKLLARMKNKSKNDTNQNCTVVQKEPVVKVVSSVDELSKEKSPLVKISQVKGTLKKDTSNSGESNIELQKVVPPQIRSEMEPSVKKCEKSREEIKAEREAKKQAKLIAKSKYKTNQAGGCESSDVGGDEKPIKVAEVSLTSNKPQKKGDESSQNMVAEPSGKSKADLKAERRAKQEAQRAAKEAGKLNKLEQKENVIPKNAKKVLQESESLITPLQKEKVVAAPRVYHQRVRLFNHLKFEPKGFEKLMHNVHPDVVRLGRKYSSRIIMGSNARCVALLKVLKTIIMDYIIPTEKEFSRGLESHLSGVMDYLNKCRPSSVSMINAVRHIKSHLTQLPNNITDVEARRKLCDVIDTYIMEQIDVAGEAICNTVQKKIANGDTILIYACSSLLFRILVESHKSGRKFTVVVVDSGPWFEGREMLRRLADNGIKCTYVLVSALNFIMREVSKVLLGAHALLANGSVMSRAGSALVALVANSCNVPVLVCCETYKFFERVQMDAFVYNELGNEEDMKYIKVKNEKENESTVVPLSVLYDITPADLVTAVVTELAILPCTSVPVILRIKPSDVVS